MKTLVSTLGLVGTAAFMAALYLNAPSFGPVEAREEPKGDCRMVDNVHNLSHIFGT